MEMLLIGYGNELCGDDAVGPRIAAAVAEWRWPGLKCLSVQQLVPELAEEVSQARVVIFADAVLQTEGQEVSMVPVTPSSPTENSAHTITPSAILSLAQTVFGQAPPAWWVLVPASQFSFGAPLSPVAQQGMEAALEQIKGLVLTQRRKAVKPQRRKAGRETTTPPTQ